MKLELFGRILKKAYSGELAAALAYRGHWKSTADSNDRNRIREIESEEWKHRDLVGKMLKDIGQKPDALREIRCYCIGRLLGSLCHIAGFFIPMYAAGKLESRNIVEYETAAHLAMTSGHPEFLDCLLQMAEVEREHEKYFREKVQLHPLIRFIGLWPKERRL